MKRLTTRSKGSKDPSSVQEIADHIEHLDWKSNAYCEIATVLAQSDPDSAKEIAYQIK
tara:strand:+ start:6418 stop:6591 length:174 start_codon:yes stop_codon:yes gene_type:complete